MTRSLSSSAFRYFSFSKIFRQHSSFSQVRLTDGEGKTRWLPPVTSTTISFIQGREIKLIKVAPTEAVCHEPVELIFLADNLPGADDLQVVLSGNNWEKKVSVLPDNLHYKKAISIYSPSLSEIKNKTKVSIYLERKGNGTITKPSDFYFFPQENKSLVCHLEINLFLKET